jgi:membrane-associated phospholipid phosphatase
MQIHQPQTLRQAILQKPIFFLGILIIWAFAAILLLSFHRKEIHLFLNAYHTPFGDAVFPWLSRLGEEAVYIAMGLIFIFKKRYKALIAMLIAILVHTGIVQTLKNFIFNEYTRPKTLFDEGVLNFVVGVEVHSYLSFPSGHTATAFSVFCLIVLFHKHWGWQVMALLAACSVAMARMYLQQHFLVDTFFGSMIGVFSALVAYFWYLKSSK